jgi:hypothetical protein
MKVIIMAMVTIMATIIGCARIPADCRDLAAAALRERGEVVLWCER